MHGSGRISFLFFFYFYLFFFRLPHENTKEFRLARHSPDQETLHQGPTLALSTSGRFERFQRSAGFFFFFLIFFFFFFLKQKQETLSWFTDITSYHPLCQTTKWGGVNIC